MLAPFDGYLAHHGCPSHPRGPVRVKGYVRKRGDAWQLAIYVGLDDRKRRQYIY